MATALPLPNGRVQFVDHNGNPLVGGTVAYYVPAGLTPKDTYTGYDEGTVNPNPITLDALGSAVVWGSGRYRQIVKDSLGNQIWDQETATAPVSDATNTGWGGVMIAGTLPSGSTDNWVPAGYDSAVDAISIRTDAGGSTLQGLSGGVADRKVILWNFGDGPLTIADEASGTTANTIYAPGFTDMIIPAGGGVLLVYDATDPDESGWDVVSPFGGTGGSGGAGKMIAATLPAGDTDNWAPTGYDSTVDAIAVVVNSDGANLRGLTGGAGNRRVVLQNIGDGGLTLINQSTSTPDNKIFTPSGEDFVIPSGGGVVLLYNTVTELEGYPAWNVVGTASGA